MEPRNRRFLIIGLALALIFLFVILTSGDSDAAEGDKPCTEVITVVDEEAYTETIEHPEVTEVIHHDAVTETTPAIWANWSPNNTQGPQDYVPIWPIDERGTWNIHDQLPPGHAGPDGVYQQGGGNSPWFYRQAEKVTVITPAYDETVVVEEAWTETIEHPEVSHEETVEVDCPDEPETPDPEEPNVPTTDTPEGPEPETPVKNPAPPVPTAVDAGAECLGGALVIKKGNTTSTINGHPSCAQVDENGEAFREEGM